MHAGRALRAVPLEAVDRALRPRALDHEAQAPGLRALRRVPHGRRQQEDVAFRQVDARVLPAVQQEQVRVAPELPEELLVRIVVEVGALVRPADHRDDEVGVLPDLLVADRGLEEVGVLLDPALEVEGQRIGGHRA
jgi:hypothetical protein